MHYNAMQYPKCNAIHCDAMQYATMQCNTLQYNAIHYSAIRYNAPSPASSMLWLAGDVKEPTCLSKRVGHEVPGVVVWPLLLHRGLGWEMLGDITCSYDKATLQSEGK